MIKFQLGIVENNHVSLLKALRNSGVSATMRRRIKHNGICQINGQSADCRDFVHSGDIITVDLPLKNNFLPQKMNLEVCYEDEYLIVINKPAGLLMHPTSGTFDGTLANGMAYYYQSTNQSCAFHPMHRLDKNTSGLVLLAKQPHIQYAFTRQHLYYQRLYMALVSGTFPSENITVNVPIARCMDSIIMRKTDVAGKDAHSDFHLIRTNGDFSLISVTLHSGRTHQIRVHSSFLGYPLLGDDLYGGSRELIQRQALHAYAILFMHPVLKRVVTVKSQLPNDMYSLIADAGWENAVSDFMGGI